LATRVTPIQARLNLMQVFKEKDHMRDPGVIDAHVYRGYEMLVEAEWKYAYTPILYSYLCPLVNMGIYCRTIINQIFQKGILIWRTRNMRRKASFWLGFTKEGHHIEHDLYLTIDQHIFYYRVSCDSYNQFEL